MLRVASRSGSRLIRYEWRPTEVRRLARGGLEVAARQIELGEKNVDEPHAVKRPDFCEGKSTESMCNKTVVDHITQIPVNYHIHTTIIS